MENNIIGTFERVDFPELGIKNVVAKVDTGAYTGAIDCNYIKVITSDKGKHLEFSPLNNVKNIITVKKYKLVPVTSSNGQTENRYAIYTTIVIRGNEYPIRITLAKRKGMKYPVLIGRRFLRINKLMVDATQINK